jgi:hypothetical protein
MKIYAKKGEHITCENGHVVCEMAKTVLYGSHQKAAQITNWRQKEPRVGDMVPVCEKCGAEFYRNPQDKGISMHFKEGWR